jgi:6-phosphofructokinase 1
LKQKVNGRRSGLVVVAEGAKPGIASKEKTADSEIKAALSPGAAEYGGSYVIERSGRISSEVALEIQRLTDLETSPLVLGQLARGGTPTVTDIQLGLGYGAGAVRALNKQLYGTMVVFQPPDLKFVPLAEVINKYRTVPVESEFIQIAHSLGISLGN